MGKKQVGNGVEQRCPLLSIKQQTANVHKGERVKIHVMGGKCNIFKI